jgi:hypothetical protein
VERGGLSTGRSWSSIEAHIEEEEGGHREQEHLRCEDERPRSTELRQPRSTVELRPT